MSDTTAQPDSKTKALYGAAPELLEEVKQYRLNLIADMCGEDHHAVVRLTNLIARAEGRPK